MGILISQLIDRLNISDEVKVIREVPFDLFSRITTPSNEAKCVFILDSKYLKNLDSTVSMVITNDEIAKEIRDENIGVCVSTNPRGLFFELLSFYEKQYARKKEKTKIGSNCIISDKAVISDYDVVIGNNVQIGDYVVIHPNSYIGDDVIIQTGARIGEQDFNVYSFDGKTKQVFHGGKVVIGSSVLISSGVLIGQAVYSYGETIVGDNCFIGADTCIGHNTEIKENCEICGNTMIGGFCQIGRNVRLFMSVTTANNIIIGDNATVNVGSVVIRDVGASKTVFGNPAREIIAPK